MSIVQNYIYIKIFEITSKIKAVGEDCTTKSDYFNRNENDVSVISRNFVTLKILSKLLSMILGN